MVRAGELKVCVQIVAAAVNSERPLLITDSRGQAGQTGALVHNQSVEVRGGSRAMIVPRQSAQAMVNRLSAGMGRSQTVCVRLYVLRAFRLVAKDDGNSSDPYVLATLGGRPGAWPRGAGTMYSAVRGGRPVAGTVVTKADGLRKGTLNPYFGLCFEWGGVVLPDAGPLCVTVMDADLDADDLIGTTTIDVADRFYSPVWRALGDSGQKVVCKPLEQRDLLKERSGVTQGGLEMWLEVFHPAPAPEAERYPCVDVSPAPREVFELRCVVWNARRMKAADLIGDMNDLYVTAHLYLRDEQGRVEERVMATDVHKRAKNGIGHFNYRLKWPDLQLPMEQEGENTGDFPRFVLKAWDKDWVTADELIGSVELPGAIELFRQAWRARVEQRSRDEILGRMSVEELRSEVQDMWSAQLRHAEAQSIRSHEGAGKSGGGGNGGNGGASRADAMVRLIKHNQSKLHTMERARLAQLLRDFDSKRQLACCSVRFPAAPKEGTGLGATVQSLLEVSGRVVSSSVRTLTDGLGSKGSAVLRAVRPRRRWLSCVCLKRCTPEKVRRCPPARPPGQLCAPGAPRCGSRHQGAYRDAAYTGRYTSRDT
jgi:hypothetical protein